MYLSEIHVTEIKHRFSDDVYKGVRKLSRPFNDFFSNVEVEKINKIFEELIKDFKLYKKRCEAFNCKYNNEFDLKLKKYFEQNKTKYINPDIWNIFTLKSDDDNLDCIKEYINKNKKFNKINCNSFKIVYRVNNNFKFSTFIIKMLDENNNEIGSINSSNKVSFKYKDKDIVEFLCDKECQQTMQSLKNAISFHIKFYSGKM